MGADHLATNERDANVATNARSGHRVWLEGALARTRERTLGMVDAWRRQVGDDLRVPHDATLNPLRWELGHIGWFETWWTVRFAQERLLGSRANPDAARTPCPSDLWYDSTRVAHAARWDLPLPSVDELLDTVAKQRSDSLALLRTACSTSSEDDALYFHRLTLMHEDMHTEAWMMMAQQLGIDPGDEMTRRAAKTHTSLRTLDVDACTFDLGTPATHSGFAFDNELGHRVVALDAFQIDASPVTWERYLPFVEAQGYAQRVWWDDDGWTWLKRHALPHPRYLRARADGRWEQRVFDAWRDLNAQACVSHVSAHEARAWCRWAGRDLPSEAQWRAAQSQHQAFLWGDVWEWTNSAFSPFEGFEPHPYRDYSMPWFDGRPVLKGASAWTSPQLAHPGYRNFFAAERNDVPAGFRSVSSAR